MKNITSKNWLKILLALGAVLLVYFFYFSYDQANPVRSELSQIQAIANNYKQQNGNFGTLLPNDNKNSCFDGNTFVRTADMQTVLTGPDVENISCVFGTATNSPVVESWSITIVKGERAFCEDSTGDRRETPGLTTKTTCIVE